MVIRLYDVIIKAAWNLKKLKWTFLFMCTEKKNSEYLLFTTGDISIVGPNQTVTMWGLEPSLRLLTQNL